MKADAPTEAAVLASLEQFTTAYQRREIDKLLGVFAPDPDVVLLGTGADEKRLGVAEIRTQAERDWAQSDAATWDLPWRSVSAAGMVAWLAAEGSVRVRAGGEEMTVPVRLTGVLERRGDRWLWVQVHASVPAAQAEGESFPA